MCRFTLKVKCLQRKELFLGSSWRIEATNRDSVLIIASLFFIIIVE